MSQVRTMSRALDAEQTGITYGEQHTARPLLTPDEVRNMPQNIELASRHGSGESVRLLRTYPELKLV